MKTRTKFGRREGGAEAADYEVVSPSPPEEPDELLAETIRLAREPLDLDEALPELVAGGMISPETASAVLQAIRETHVGTQAAIKDVFESLSKNGDTVRTNELTAAALETIGKFAERPDPPAPDIHVHMPKQDVTVHTPDFKPEITVEGSEIHVPAQEAAHIDVHVPEQPAPQVTVAAATPDVVVQPATAAAPIVNVNMPDEIRTIPAEVETVAERDADDLIVRSVTRPTGE